MKKVSSRAIGNAGKAFVLALFVALAATACAEPLRIGAILPLTGAAAGNGEQLLHGIEFGKQQIRNASRLVFEVEDFGSSPNQVLTAYQKLGRRGSLAAVTAFSSPAAMALRDIARRDGIPLFGITAAPGFTASPGFTFRLSSSAVDEANFIRKLWNDQGIKRITLVYAEDDYGTSYSTLFAADPEVTSVALPPGETDLRSTLARVRGGRPELVILALFGQQAGLFVRQASETKFATPTLCAQACTNPDFFRVGAGAAEGTFISTPIDVENPALRAAYRRRFNEEPSFVTWTGYDVVAVVACLQEECEGRSEPAKCIRDAAASGRTLELARGKAAFDRSGELHFPQQLNIATNGQIVRCEQQSLKCRSTAG
jgi:branched-chain amino acid transport system substrate-binding protein